MSRKNLTFFMSLLLIFSFILGACTTPATPTDEAATEVMTEEVAEPTEEVAPTDEPTAEPAPTDVPTEAPTDEPTEPELTVDPTGQTVVFWHVWGAGSAAEGLAKIVADFNASNEWGITVEPIDAAAWPEPSDAPAVS